MKLSGKRVLVTGGGTGVGADLARGFSEAGAEVFIAGRTRAPLEAVAARLHRVSALTCDVTDEASVKTLFAETGPCDIVIANAGAADSTPLSRMTLEQWNAALGVNLTGVFLTFREGLAHMTGWGRLIAIASTAGLKGYPYVAHYVAAKHGVVGLARALALEVAKRPITVNALCPGFLDTEMTRRSIATIVEKTGCTPDEARARLASLNPQNRLIEPAEVTASALFLCRPGSEGINGQAISISGAEI